MLDLSEIAMHDRAIDDGVVVRPKNHVSDFIWGNESTETIHGAEVIENALVVAKTCWRSMEVSVNPGQMSAVWIPSP